MFQTTKVSLVRLGFVFVVDFLKFRIYDRFEESDEVLLYDSAADAAVDAVDTAGDMFTSLTFITETLPLLDDVTLNDAIGFVQDLTGKFAYNPEKAKELLKLTKDRIIEIAEKCGYNDVYYFSHSFKKFMGVSPRNYREKYNT